MTMNNEFVQAMLDAYFPVLNLKAEQVKNFRLQSTVLNFPASLYCDCKNCTKVRTGWQVKWVSGRTLYITTTVGEFTTWVPGDAPKHEW